jgi:type II secretory pathway pseudopilin PulG
MKDSNIGMGKMRKRTRRGVSLIEVLVVLVLLVLGILIIVRLYPSGFFSITSVGNAALADSLGQAAVQTQAQNTTGLPESILPVSQTNDLTPAVASDANYDPDFNPNVEADYSKILDKARVINNETITVPAASGATRQSVYVVNYGPIVMPVVVTAMQLPKYLSINSPYWQALSGNFNDALGATPDYPQVTIFPGQQRLLVDYTNGKVAIPYAQKYDQPFVLMVVATDPNTKTDKVYTLGFKIPHSGNDGPPVMDDPHDISFGSHPPFYADSQKYYNGGWFDPAGNNTDAAGKTYKYNTDSSLVTPPLPWKGVMLYRAFKGVADTTSFSADPYEFTLTSPNITDTASASLANVGAIAFNPLAAGGSGSSALKARISYVTYSWKVLHEDRDIPALSGTDTAVTRLTLKNLKRAGDNNPDNSIYTGLIPNSFLSMIALDLDTGKAVGPAQPVPDPTATEGNIWDEDLNGTKLQPPYDLINVSFSTGRVTFQSNSFADNANNTNPRTHRVRLFYMGDADWTVAVQKAPSYYTLSPNTTAGGADPMLLPGQYAFDATRNLLYFPRSDAGKSVEIDGTYVVGSGASAQLKTFAGTIAIQPTVMPLGTSSYVAVDLTASTLTGGPTDVSNISQGSVTVTAVRGLSVRSIVAWKERDRWKVHSVDTLLNRAQ